VKISPPGIFFLKKMTDKPVLGEKLEMGRVFTEEGKRIPITRIQLITDKPGLKPGDLVKVTGVSKGKGFTGVMKRWGFKGGPRTHGQSDRERAPGSIGQTTSPGRVWKGKKMAGRAGKRQVTIKNLKVVSLDEKTKILALSGPIPGPRKGTVRIWRV
jgi:50S ribosomal protein uL3